MLDPKDCFILPSSSFLIDEQITKSNEDDHTCTTKKHVAIVTGSNCGIGFHTASALVNHGYDVILACRSRDKGEQAVNMINSQANKCTRTPPAGKAIFLHPLDLSSLSSVQSFVDVFKAQYEELHILVNNAGINTTGKSTDGMDLCFQTNFVGHFMLTNALLPQLLKAKNKLMIRQERDNTILDAEGKAKTEHHDSHKFMEEAGRIVNLSSVTHHFVRSDEERQEPYSASDRSENDSHHDYLWWEGCTKPGVSSNTYKESKLASILFTYELNKRFNKHGIKSIAVNPGAVNSDIWRGYPRWMVHIFQLLFLTSEQGSSTSVAGAIGNIQDATYLQPYWQPPSLFRKKKEEKVVYSSSFKRFYQLPFPLFEMLGRYIGFAVTEARIPAGIEGSSLALWNVCESIKKKSRSLS